MRAQIVEILELPELCAHLPGPEIRDVEGRELIQQALEIERLLDEYVLAQGAVT